LQLQLQLRDGTLARGGQRDVDEVADPFDRQAEVREVAFVQLRRRVVAFEVRDRRGVDEQCHPKLAVRLTQEQLLARRARRLHLAALVGVDDERVDREARLDAIERLQPELQPCQQRARALPPAVH